MAGRPTLYTEAIGDEICERLAAGESLIGICREERMPAESTVRAWALDAGHPISAKYTRARELQAERLADEIFEIADDGTNDWMTRTLKGGLEIEVPNEEVLSRSRLRVEARKWYLSKVLPKKYGESKTLRIEDVPTEKLIEVLESDAR